MDSVIFFRIWRRVQFVLNFNVSWKIVVFSLKKSAIFIKYNLLVKIEQKKFLKNYREILVKIHLCNTDIIGTGTGAHCN